MTYPRIIEGHVWREDGHQQTRYIRVIQVLGPMVRVISCSYNGIAVPDARPMQIAKSLFGKIGGYRKQ